MSEILIIKTNETEKIKVLLNQGHANYEVVYQENQEGEIMDEKQLTQAYKEWSNDPNEQKDITGKY